MISNIALMLSGHSYPIGILINLRCVLANKNSLFGWLFSAESCCLMSPTRKRKQILGARCSGSWCTCTLLTLARSSTMSSLFLLKTAVIGKTTSHSWKTFQIFWKVGTDGWTIVETFWLLDYFKTICITILFKEFMQFSTKLKKTHDGYQLLPSMFKYNKFLMLSFGTLTLLRCEC